MDGSAGASDGKICQASIFCKSSLVFDVTAIFTGNKFRNSVRLDICVMCGVVVVDSAELLLLAMLSSGFGGDATAPKSNINSFSSTVLCERRRLLAARSSPNVGVSTMICGWCGSTFSDTILFGVPCRSITSNELETENAVWNDLWFAIELMANTYCFSDPMYENLDRFSVESRAFACSCSWLYSK